MPQVATELSIRSAHVRERDGSARGAHRSVDTGAHGDGRRRQRRLLDFVDPTPTPFHFRMFAVRRGWRTGCVRRGAGVRVAAFATAHEAMPGREGGLGVHPTGGRPEHGGHAKHVGSTRSHTLESAASGYRGGMRVCTRRGGAWRGLRGRVRHAILSFLHLNVPEVRADRRP